MPIRYSPRTKHSASYYRGVLTTLMDGLNEKFSDSHIAQLLNDRGLAAATGGPWTATTVKHTLYSLRHSQVRSNRLHRALLEFVYAGVLTVAQSWILFQPRRVRGAM